jgi:lipoprotein signal peptidase
MFQGVEFWTALAIFFGYFILDIGSSWFIIALNRLQLGTTTILTFLLYMGSGIGIFKYTHNISYLVFAALGASLGNFVLVLIAKRQQKFNKEKKSE